MNANPIGLLVPRCCFINRFADENAIVNLKITERGCAAHRNFGFYGLGNQPLAKFAVDFDGGHRLDIRAKSENRNGVGDAFHLNRFDNTTATSAVCPCFNAFDQIRQAANRILLAIISAKTAALPAALHH